MVVARQCLILQLAVLQVDYLLEMEDVVNTLQYVSDELLLVLDLHRGIWHQQRVWNGDIYSFNLIII